MTGKSHQTIGQLCGLSSYLYLVQPHYGPATLSMVAVVSSIGALFPDIDTPTAKIWSYIPFGAGQIGGQLVNPFLQHRNLTHSLLGYGLVTALFWRLLEHLPTYWGIHSNQVFLAGTLAYGSHLLADSVTVQGIPLLFPYQKMFGIPPYPFQGFRIETGRWFENLIVYPAVNLALVAMLVDRWTVVRQILFQ